MSFVISFVEKWCESHVLYIFIISDYIPYTILAEELWTSEATHFSTIVIAQPSITREVTCSLTQYTLSQSSQLEVRSIESLPEVVIQGLLFAVEEYGGTAIHDSLRGTLHHQQVARIIGVFCLVDGHLRHIRLINEGRKIHEMIKMHHF